MPYPRKIVLHCPNGYEPRLNALIEGFLRDGVAYIGVVGKDCTLVEEMIDELVVGSGNRDYNLLTSSHPNESVEDALQFAEALEDEFQDEVSVVVL